MTILQQVSQRYGISPCYSLGITVPKVPAVDSYSAQIPGGNQFLELRLAEAPGMPPWLMAHRPNTTKAVHILPIIFDPSTQTAYAHLICQKSPPFGGKPVMQLPAGLWGDQLFAELAHQVAARELREETGYEIAELYLWGGITFATSSGMTDEQKAFAMAIVKGSPTGEFREESERASIIGTEDVELSTFIDSRKFHVWCHEHLAAGRLVSMDVLGARSMLF